MVGGWGWGRGERERERLASGKRGLDKLRVRARVPDKEIELRNANLVVYARNVSYTLRFEPHSCIIEGHEQPMGTVVEQFAAGKVACVQNSSIR